MRYSMWYTDINIGKWDGVQIKLGRNEVEKIYSVNELMLIDSSIK